MQHLDDLPSRGPSHPLLVFFSRVGRGLRYVGGVDEAVMDRLPYLRAWYACVGAAVLMTGVIASISMWFAVQQATSVHPVLAVVPAAVWFVFIVVMDRWIVSSRSGDAWQRIILLGTRSVLAILFGIVIAEPLVLKVFENQIVQQVQNERSTNLSQLQAAYVACNPDPAASPPAPATPDDCVASGYDLGIGTALAGQGRELEELKDQAADLEAKIAEERAHLLNLQQLAADECAGVSRPGTTGRYGEGINCRRDTQAASDYNNSVPWDEQEAQLLELHGKITSLQSSVTDGQRSFGERRAAAISDRLADQPQVTDPVGLLQRMEILHQLASANFTLLVGVWMVRLLFIAIDCSPVLMKIAAGRTHYDRWVDGTLEHVVDAHHERLKGVKLDLKFDQDVREQQRRRDQDLAERRLQEDAIDRRERSYRDRGD